MFAPMEVYFFFSIQGCCARKKLFFPFDFTVNNIESLIFEMSMAVFVCFKWFKFFQAM